MAIDDRLPAELPTENSNLTPLFYLFVLIPTVLGIAHHVDHIIRGNHVGWPITAEVNPFTYSLAVYPLFGYVAFAVVLALIGPAVVGSVYGAVLWYRDNSGSENEPSNRFVERSPKARDD